MTNDYILIIDDSPLDRKVMKKILENSNSNIKVIENEMGEGYEQQIIEFKVKAIILDLILGSVDGVEILRKLKQHSDTSCIPVIICSSIKSYDKVQETLSIGAYDYFEKPLSDMAIRFSLALKIKNALDIKKHTEHINFLRDHDELTGLKTRKYFEMMLNSYIGKQSLPLSVIIMDINGLKVINDAYGHDVGDLVLKELSFIIKNTCLEAACLARWGSDEMVIFISNRSKRFVDDLMNTIRQKIDIIKSYQYDVSFGWATEDKSLEKAKQLAQRAEDNLYSNKVLESSSVRSNMIESIIHTLHQKNPREEMHSQRVSFISEKIAIELGFSVYEIKRVKLAGLMHDIGKISINEDILNKPGKLDNKEWEQIKKHPELGFKILSTSVDTMEIANATLSHHERWDGRGYPKGLSSENIPIMSRIIAVADTFDAMTSNRTYRNSTSKEVALTEIKNCSGSQFDPIVVEAFERYYKKYESKVNFDRAVIKEDLVIINL